MEEEIKIGNWEERLERGLEKLEQDPLVSEQNRELILRYLRYARLGKTLFGRAKKKIGPARLLTNTIHLTTFLHFVQIGGRGGCDLDLQPTFNKYDFIRYGTISSGEQVVSADPPIGDLDRTEYPDLDRFNVTFDSPNYVTIDQITVEVADGGDPPVVIKTRRPLNSDPETVEIVLDRPLVIGETTTFTLNDGTVTNVVEYTLVDPVPTTSAWTLFAMTLLVLTAGTLVPSVYSVHVANIDDDGVVFPGQDFVVVAER